MNLKFSYDRTTQCISVCLFRIEGGELANARLALYITQTHPDLDGVIRI